MDSFRETAFYLTVWHAFLAALASVLLIVLNDIEPATALLISANLALLFSLLLVARAALLDERRVARGQFWRTLPPKQRPAGEAGLRMARKVLEETWLKFARAAAAVAIVLSALAYLSNGVSAIARADAVLAPAPQAKPGNLAWVAIGPRVCCR